MNKKKKDELLNRPIELVRLEKHNEFSINPEYQDAVLSYNKIYNIINKRGKSELRESDPISLLSKPINLDVNNFYPLARNSYYASTKADGLRFFMLFSDGMFKHQIEKFDEESSKTIYRDIYFMDSLNNFWKIMRSNKKLESLKGIDNCIIDGELLFWGHIEKSYDNNGQVNKYIIMQDHANNIYPYIAFLAFDIIYGPIDPKFTSESTKYNIQDRDDSYDKHSANTTLDFGNSSAMIGFKGEKIWPTKKRREILETMFFNKKSILNVNYKLFGYFSLIEQFHTIGFTILVQPFIDFDTILKQDDVYSFMKNNYERELSMQYFNNTGYAIQKIDTEESDKGLGLLTDGLILTPVNSPYLVGNWTFGSNKQYKWKPDNKLTIDFELGSGTENKGYVYFACLISSKNFSYKISDENKDVIIIIPKKTVDKLGIVPGLIVEALVKNKFSNQNYIEAEFIKIRTDKKKSNSILTAISTIDMILFGSNKLLDFISLLRSNDFTSLDQNLSIKEDIFKYSSNNNKIICFFKNNPSSLINYNILKHYIKQYNLSRKQSFLKGVNLEIETKIKFNNENRPYLLSLSKNTLNEPIKYIRIYGRNHMRSTWAYKYSGKEGISPDISKSLFLISIEQKIPKKEESSISNTIKKIYYLKNISIDYSEETIITSVSIDILTDLFSISDEKSIKILEKILSHDNLNIETLLLQIYLKNVRDLTIDVSYIYQERYILSNISNFWSIEVIQFSSSKESIKDCIYEFNKGFIEKDGGQHVRIEIEYSPGLYYNNIFNQLKNERNQEIENKLNISSSDDIEILQKEFNNTLFNTSTLYIFKDYIKTLTYVLDNTSS